MHHILKRCEEDLEKLFSFFDERNAAVLQSSTSGNDFYERANTVPVNPPRLTLDYDNHATCEGQLKVAVLREEICRVVGIVASGNGGVGKTCAIRGLAVDPDIEKKFPGGTLYIQLGNDATINHLISGLARIVKRTGGSKLSEKIKNSKTLQEASDEASHWFRNAACLFLVDDIWCVNDIDSEVLTILASMVNKSSRLVCTSRDKHFLGRAHQVIMFEGTETDSEQSREMLWKPSGFSEATELDQRNKDAFEAILAECRGLPLAFGIAGGSVHKLSNRRDRKQDAWSDVHKTMSVLLHAKAEQYGGLSKIVDVSLQVLEVHCQSETYERMFRALCILQKQQRAPVSMLQKLWNLDSLDVTVKTAEAMDDLSIIQLRRYNDGLCVQLHDLVLDIARDKASKACETQSFFQTLIRNYTRIQRDWWNIEDDGYLHNNLCRVLSCAGNFDELLRLLSEPKWVVCRLLNGGINSLQQDLKEGESVLPVSGNDSGYREYLEMVGKAARLGCTFFEGNEREIYFQLYGRLLWHASRNDKTQEFLKKLEDRAPRLWVKASMGLLQQAGSGALDFISSSGTVLDIHQEEETISFIWSTGERLGVSQYNTSTGLSQTVDCVDESLEFPPEDAAFLIDQCTIVSAHKDEGDRKLKLILWSRKTGAMMRVVELKKLQGKRSNRRWRNMCSKCVGSSGRERKQPPESLQFVGFSKTGTRVATADRNHSIQVWDTCSGAAVGEPLRGHTDWVRCVAVSADGTRILSGSDDETVRVWDAQSGAAVGEPLRGHSHSVMCVAVSADGTRIVSGSDDKTVRVWDAQSGAAVGEPLRGHSHSVMCVAVSADGTRIVSGSHDKTVRVWDAQSQKQVGTAIVHEEAVHAIAVTADCSRIATKDGTKARLWDAQRAVCVLTSDDDAWRSIVHALNLSWSTTPFWIPSATQVTSRGDSGCEMVLATCETAVENVGDGDVYWDERFQACAVICR